MSYNGAGLFVVNSAGQPVVSGTSISSATFNAFTADIASGLSNAICKDGQTVVTANIPLGGFRITGLGLGTALTDAARVDNANALNMCEFRLTLTSGVPVTTADVTGATTIYCSPYKGNRIALFDGTSWHMRTSAEFSGALGAVTSGLPYDVFCYDNAGVPTLDFLAWTNTTTRATAIVLQDGVPSKSGALTRRLLGTFFTTSVTATEDSFANRYLSNYYNRCRRPMRAVDTTNTWNYTLATIRQANASAANQLNFVLCASEEMVSAEIQAAAFNSAGAVALSVGIGLDSTTTFTTGCLLPYSAPSVNVSTVLVASLKTFPGVGKHFLSWNEVSGVGGATTWVGDNGVTTAQSGIHGEVWG